MPSLRVAPPGLEPGLSWSRGTRTKHPSAASCWFTSARCRMLPAS